MPPNAAIASIIESIGEPMRISHIHKIYYLEVAPETINFIQSVLANSTASLTKTSRQYNMFYLTYNGLIGILSWPQKVRHIEEGWKFCEYCDGRGCEDCLYRGVVCWIDRIVGIKKLLA
ncbi:hypothetical protein KAR91_28075 [Candidatus Pacearchaeota archaeon]|nr:hypothetical protein [Candidatus Pacearchaeota archaeon]